MKKQIVGALAFLGWSFLASACGLISGVSDDYTYERAGADGGADAISATDSTVDSQPPPNDAQIGDARPEAGNDAALVCAGAFRQPTGIADVCYACVLKNCCVEAQRCAMTTASTDQCGTYLKCLGNCKPGTGGGGDTCRLQCTLGRDGGPPVGPLASCQFCKTPECAGPP